MREILFRGKDLNNEWHYGVPLVYKDLDGNVNVVCITAPFMCNEAVEVETVGQYTGLKDKNGTKIFEGDYWVDTDESDIFVVEFKDGQYCFAIYGNSCVLTEGGYYEYTGIFDKLDCVPMTDYYIENIEIVGNIHDNPKLLKE